MISSPVRMEPAARMTTVNLKHETTVLVIVGVTSRPIFDFFVSYIYNFKAQMRKQSQSIAVN